MHHHLRCGMLPLQFQDFFQRKLLVHMAGAVPDHHILASGQLLDIGTQVPVGCEDDRLVGRNRLYDLQGIGRGAAHIRQGFHPDRSIDVRNHLVAGIFRLESRESGRIARFCQRTSRFEIRKQHLLFRREHLGRLCHEMHAGEEDDPGVGLLRLDGERQRIAQEIGYFLHFGQRIVVRQDNGVLLAFEPLDFRFEFR